MNVIPRIRTIGSTILGGALIVGIVSVFLPWRAENLPGVPTSENGFSSGGGFLYFFVILDAGVFFLIRVVPWEMLGGNPLTGIPKRMALPIADWLLYLIAGIASLGAALLFFSQLPQDNKDFCFSPTCTDVILPSYGPVIAIVAAIAICAGAILKRKEPQPPPSGRRAYSLVLGILGVDALVFLIYVLGHVPTIM
jgi:hypothetical protein